MSQNLRASVVSNICNIWPSPAGTWLEPMTFCFSFRARSWLCNSPNQPGPHTLRTTLRPALKYHTYLCSSSALEAFTTAQTHPIGTHTTHINTGIPSGLAPTHDSTVKVLNERRAITPRRPPNVDDWAHDFGWRKRCDFALV